MRGPFLVLLLLAAALGAHAQVVETKYKDGKHHARRDVRKDYSYKTAEEHQQQHGYGPGPGPKQDRYNSPPKADSYGGYHKQEDSYGGYQKQECHDGCPNPQPPESVTDAHRAHYSFVWAELAQEYANSGDGETNGGDKQAPSNQKRKSQKRHQVPIVPGEDSFNPSMAWLKQQASKLTKQQQQQPGGSSRDQPAAAEAAVAAAAVAAAANNGTTAQIAAVTNPDFLVPTDRDYTERGFEGTYDTAIPTDEALAVGPHPADEDSVLVLHGVKRMWQIFSASRDGKKIDSSVPTKIPAWLISQKMGFNTSATSPMNTAYPRAFFDKVDNRFVLTYGVVHYTYQAEEGDPFSHLVVCVSAGNNPLADWTCWALDARVMVASPNTYMCDGLDKGAFIADSPVPSYSVDGFFTSIVAFCVQPDGTAAAHATAVHVFPKKALYGPPPSESAVADFKIWRATYLPSQSWYYSLPPHDQVLLFDKQPLPGYVLGNEFGAAIMPALPQTAHDAADPVLVMGKVDGGAYMSLAKFTGELSWNDMDSRHNAPRIYAAVVKRPDDFRNVPPYTILDDLAAAVIPQPGPEDTPSLDAGTDLLAYDSRASSATKFRGLVFSSTQEFFGSGKTRLPSIFWSIVDPSPRLCSPSLESWGLLASADGLALSTPVIAGRSECGAFLAFSYGANTTIELNSKRYPAYAGAARAVVGCEGAREEITVVKRGEGLITRGSTTPLRWGYYAAWDSLDGMIWTAVPVALDTELQYGSWISTERC